MDMEQVLGVLKVVSDHGLHWTPSSYHKIIVLPVAWFITNTTLHQILHDEIFGNT